MSFSSTLCDGVELRRLAVMEMYVSIMVWKHCFSVQFGFLRILLIMASSLCCRLQDMMKIVVMVRG